MMAATVDTVAHAMRRREAEQTPQTFTRNDDGTWTLEAG